MDGEYKVAKVTRRQKYKKDIAVMIPRCIDLCLKLAISVTQYLDRSEG